MFRTRLICRTGPLVFLVVGVLTQSASHAAVQISLDPSNVIGGTQPYPFSPSDTFADSNILDHQTGTITEPFAHGYWLNTEGLANPYITISLGGSYQLTQFELYNTANGTYGDRGTGDFTIVAGNSITSDGSNGYTLSGPTTVVASGTLAAATTAQAVSGIPGQDFASSDTTDTFKYIQFLPTSVATENNPCCGPDNYGLNELKVFTTPEPASLVVWGMVIAGGLVAARRRRKA